jgi:hypothetical protein
MSPWIGENGLGSIVKGKTPSPSSIPFPNSGALLMLVELRNGHYITLLPLSEDTSVSWLKVFLNGELIKMNFISLGNHFYKGITVRELAKEGTVEIEGAIK